MTSILPRTSSLAKIAANRAQGRQSEGAMTPAGKAPMTNSEITGYRGKPRAAEGDRAVWNSIDYLGPESRFCFTGFSCLMPWDRLSICRVELGGEHVPTKNIKMKSAPNNIMKTKVEKRHNLAWPMTI